MCHGVTEKMTECPGENSTVFEIAQNLRSVRDKLSAKGNPVKRPYEISPLDRRRIVDLIGEIFAEVSGRSLPDQQRRALGRYAHYLSNCVYDTDRKRIASPWVLHYGEQVLSLIRNKTKPRSPDMLWEEGRHCLAALCQQIRDLLILYHLFTLEDIEPLLTVIDDLCWSHDEFSSLVLTKPVDGIVSYAEEIMLDLETIHRSHLVGLNIHTDLHAMDCRLRSLLCKVNNLRKSACPRKRQT